MSPTVVIDSRLKRADGLWHRTTAPASPIGGSRVASCLPEPNRLLLFDSGLLHGVLGADEYTAPVNDARAEAKAKLKKGERGGTSSSHEEANTKRKTKGNTLELSCDKCVEKGGLFCLNTGECQPHGTDQKSLCDFTQVHFSSLLSCI